MTEEIDAKRTRNKYEKIREAVKSKGINILKDNIEKNMPLKELLDIELSDADTVLAIAVIQNKEMWEDKDLARFLGLQKRSLQTARSHRRFSKGVRKKVRDYFFSNNILIIERSYVIKDKFLVDANSTDLHDPSKVDDLVDNAVLLGREFIEGDIVLHKNIQKALRNVKKADLSKFAGVLF